MGGHNVRIEQENERVANVYIDGKKLEGVQYVNYRIGVNDIPVITIEFIPGTLNFDKEKESKNGLNLSVMIDGEKIVDKVVTELQRNLKLQNIKGVVV